MFKTLFSWIKSFFSWMLRLFGIGNTPQPPIDDPDNPLPVDVKIVVENGKTYKYTYYADGTYKKEEIK